MCQKKKALGEASNYEDTFYIRILCIPNKELKLFNLGYVFKKFHNLQIAKCLQQAEFLKMYY